MDDVKGEKEELMRLVEKEREYFDSERRLWKMEKAQLQGEVRQLKQLLESIRKLNNDSTRTD